MANATLASTETDDFIWSLKLMNGMVTYPVRQFVTCLLSGFFVVGILLIIPAMVQTAAAYVWAAQLRKELVRSSRVVASTLPQLAHDRGAGQVEAADLAPTDINAVRKVLSQQDRTLFLYRLLACTASLLVLIFSTLPQLVLVVSREGAGGGLDQQWGWCQALIYADYASRCFATYLIVIPFGLIFWNYLFSEIVPRHHLLTDNVFQAILRAAVPIALFSLLSPIGFVIRRYQRDEQSGLCGSNPQGLMASLYYDFVVTRVVPAVLVVIIGAGFLNWLERSDYGVFYEPAIFLFLVSPHMCTEACIHILHGTHMLDRLVEKNFSNFMLIAYSFYHMSFSGTFVFATLRSVISEIREEMRRRQLFFLVDQPEKLDEVSAEIHGTKRRTDLIVGLQKQFSVAFRWKPDFTEEETRTFIENPLHAIVAESRTAPIESPTSDDTDNEKQDVPKLTNEDVILHYAILQRSAHLKKGGHK